MPPSDEAMRVVARLRSMRDAYSLELAELIDEQILPLRADLEQVQYALTKARETRRTIRATMNRYRDALRKYADEENWDTEHHDDGPESLWIGPPTGGPTLARAALAPGGGEGEA